MSHGLGPPSLHFLQHLNFGFQLRNEGFEIFVAGLLLERKLNVFVDFFSRVGMLQEGPTEIIGVIWASKGDRISPCLAGQLQSLSTPLLKLLLNSLRLNFLRLLILLRLGHFLLHHRLVSRDRQNT